MDQEDRLDRDLDSHCTPSLTDLALSFIDSTLHQTAGGLAWLGWRYVEISVSRTDPSVNYNKSSIFLNIQIIVLIHSGDSSSSISRGSNSSGSNGNLYYTYPLIMKRFRC